MMCSAFVANAMKVGFGSVWPTLNSHEFTPKDVYQVRIYNDGKSEEPRFNASNCPDGLIEDRNPLLNHRVTIVPHNPVI